MNKRTYLEIHLKKIRNNASAIIELCNRSDIEVVGVTKGVCALIPVVNEMVEGGITHLADSRISNLKKLRENGFNQKMTLLRIPGISEAKDVVDITEYSLNSEIETIKALSEKARLNAQKHQVIIMLDVGDLREGLMPGYICETVRKALALPGISVAGIGTNMGCFGGILPTEKNLNYLLKMAALIKNTTGLSVTIVSGGGTSSLKLVAEGKMPEGINQLRIGEGILLGTDSTRQEKISWLEQDTFMLNTEVIELKMKPSVPIGEIGKDAFGNAPVFKDEGLRKRAIVMVGRQDVPPEGLVPIDDNIKILGASSDHMIVDVTDSDEHITIGSQIQFRPNYQGMLYLCNSRYIEKQYI